jgi:hypothetical protein
MEKENKIISLYNGEIQIKFIEESHQYWLQKSATVPKAKRLSGVTSYTGLIDKSRVLLTWSENLSRDYLLQRVGQTINQDIIEEAVTLHRTKKEEAADTGKMVHNWIETYIKNKILNGELPVYPQEEKAMNGILAFLKWEADNKVQWLESEKIVYSKQYRYVGTAVAIAVVNGVKYLIDFKTGKAIYTEAHLQVSGYIQAYDEEFGEKLEGLILHFDKETGEFAETKANISLETFIGLVKLKN